MDGFVPPISGGSTVLLEVVDMETDPEHREICLLATNHAKGNQRRRMHDDVDELEGFVNICVRKIRVEGRRETRRKQGLY